MLPARLPEHVAEFKGEFLVFATTYQNMRLLTDQLMRMNRADRGGLHPAYQSLVLIADRLEVSIDQGEVTVRCGRGSNWCSC